jgi:hypothetical protein
MAAALDTVTAMIAPALFMTASSSLLISTSNRMARIVDRIRTLVERDDASARRHDVLDFPEVRRRHLENQLRQLQWRSDRIRLAVTMLYLSLAAFAATSMSIAIDSLTGHRYTIVAVCLAIAGVALLLVACANLVMEARSALQSNGDEIRNRSELESHRKAAAEAAKSDTSAGSPA